ncbi:MAG: TetR/AcrR family transcriptional regulator [Pseudomonadales bacterium]
MAPQRKPLQETRARRSPTQARALLRRDQILQTTAALLAEVGFDDLTTILIAKRLNISVGTLYHYFPNKIAILYALAESWLDSVSKALEDMWTNLPQVRNVAEFNDYSVERLLSVYRQQKGMLSLVQAMWAVPELRELDDKHDELMISQLSKMFSQLGIQQSKSELSRISRAYLEVVHSLSLVIVEQNGIRAKRTTGDLKAMTLTLISR